MRFAGLVRPNSLVVGTWADAVHEGRAASSVIARADAVARVLAVYDYVETPGVEHFERLPERRSGNCLSLACAACSVLRRLGQAPDDVCVGVVIERALGPLSVHAVLLAREPDTGEVCVWDPRLDSATVQAAAQLRSAYRPLVFFNDAFEGPPDQLPAWLQAVSTHESS